MEYFDNWHISFFKVLGLIRGRKCTYEPEIAGVGLVAASDCVSRGKYLQSAVSTSKKKGYKHMGTPPAGFVLSHNYHSKHGTKLN